MRHQRVLSAHLRASALGEVKGLRGLAELDSPGLLQGRGGRRAGEAEEAIQSQDEAATARREFHDVFSSKEDIHLERLDAVGNILCWLRVKPRALKDCSFRDIEHLGKC